nr:formate/nitrite transporter family protein [Lachnospiraceae bacterium]
GLFESCDGELVDLVTRTTQAKVSLTFMEAFLRGIPCNMLVTIAVLLGLASKDVTGKILGLFFPTMLFVVSGFEHSVANMYFIFAGIFADLKCGVGLECVNARSVFLNNLLPVTLGNIIGGMLIVGLGYWFAHRSGEKE